MKENADESQRIGMLIKHIDKKLMCGLNTALSKYDITVMQHHVLAYVYCNQYKGDVFQRNIEDVFKCSNPTITGILKRLEAKDYISREYSHADARYKKITTTPKGEEVMESTKEHLTNKMRRAITQNLNSNDVQELERLLNLILKGLED